MDSLHGEGSCSVKSGSDADGQLAQDIIDGGESDEEDKGERDVSKATRHTLANKSAANRNRPLQVVKKGGNQVARPQNSLAIDPNTLPPLPSFAPTNKVISTSNKTSNSSNGSRSGKQTGNKDKGGHRAADNKDDSGRNHQSPDISHSNSVLNTSRQSNRLENGNGKAGEPKKNDKVRKDQRHRSRSRENKRGLNISLTSEKRGKNESRHRAQVEGRRRSSRSRTPIRTSPRRISPRRISPRSISRERSPAPRNRKRSVSPPSYKQKRGKYGDERGRRGLSNNGRGPNRRNDPFYRRETNRLNWNNRISAVCSSSERRDSVKSTKLSREVEAMVKQQLDSFKQAYDEEVQIKMKESSEEAYRRGRKEAEMKDFES